MFSIDMHYWQLQMNLHKHSSVLSIFSLLLTTQSRELKDII